MTDSSDPKTVAKAIKTAKQRDEANEDALRTILATVSGRAWVYSILDRCHPFATPFSTDPLRMAHNCGEANIGLQLLAELHACSTELYLVMMKENTP